MVGVCDAASLEGVFLLCFMFSSFLCFFSVGQLGCLSRKSGVTDGVQYHGYGPDYGWARQGLIRLLVLSAEFVDLG
jgi:hypothetical protein